MGHDILEESGLESGVGRRREDGDGGREGGAKGLGGGDGGVFGKEVLPAAAAAAAAARRQTRAPAPEKLRLSHLVQSSAHRAGRRRGIGHGGTVGVGRSTDADGSQRPEEDGGAGPARHRSH